MTKGCAIISRRFAVITFGIISIWAGVYLLLNWTEIFTQLRGKEMALSPSSKSYPDWKVSPLPLYFDVYLFNWTNPQEFYVGSKVKPHFQQLGPYRFREQPDKVNIEWHTHNFSVTFRKKSLFYFDAAGSRGRLTDRVTSVNTVAHAAALRAKDANILQRALLRQALRSYREDVSITKTADEWMFTGYADPLVTIGNFVSKFSRDIVVPYDRVGYMYTRNGSASFDGLINMFTGADDMHKLGQIHTWNGKTHTGAYDGECGDVKGSMGEFFPPNLSWNDTVYLYMPNMCRAVPLDYTETVKIHGVTAYKFSGGERLVDNGTLYPETKCFCVNGKCEAAGVLNISPCKYNSSIYMSYPHFYKADPSYLEAIDGLRPEKDKHEFFMTLEPNAGLPMDVGGGFQANYLLEPVAISPFNNIPRVFIPLMWCEERVRVTVDIANDIALVPLFILLGQLVTATLWAFGLIMVCWYPAKYVTQMCHDPVGKAKNPLFNGQGLVIRSLTTVDPQKVITSAASDNHQRNADGSAAVPLIEYKKGSIVVNGTMTAGLIGGDALKAPNGVITR